MRLNGSEITVSLLESQGKGSKEIFLQKQNLQKYRELYRSHEQYQGHERIVGFKMRIETETKDYISIDSYQKVFRTRDEAAIDNKRRKSVLIVIDLQNDIQNREYVFSQQPKVKFIEKPMNDKNKPEIRKITVLNLFVENEINKSPKCFYKMNNMKQICSFIRQRSCH